MGRIIEHVIGDSPIFTRAHGAKSIFPLVSLLALAACAIHPVQKDVTGFRTVDIVDHIRCETRLAIQDKAIAMLRQYGERNNNPKPIAFADDLSRKRGKIWDFVDPRRLDPRERAFYIRYVRTGIAYDFTFDISEDNKASAVLDPVKLITNGTVGVGLNGSGDFNRNNSRHFIVSDNFENLLFNRSLTCDDDYRPANFAYPIAGSVGMAELLDTFIDLNEDKDLGPLDTGSSRVFADTLTFATTLVGSVSPHIELTPVGNRWGLASPTNFAASAQRVDTHKMIIGLSMEPAQPTDRVAALGLPVAGTKSALQKTMTNPAEQRALNAVSQQRLDTFYDRFGTLAR
jgi:hypothetical protein